MLAPRGDGDAGWDVGAGRPSESAIRCGGCVSGGWESVRMLARLQKKLRASLETLGRRSCGIVVSRWGG